MFQILRRRLATANNFFKLKPTITEPQPSQNAEEKQNGLFSNTYLAPKMKFRHDGLCFYAVNLA